MKYINYLLLVISLIFFAACGSNSDPINYPVTYTYQKNIYEKPGFFVLDASLNLNTIVASGNFTEFEAGVKEVMNSALEQDDNIKSVELLSENKAKITLFDGTTSDITYEKNANTLVLILDADTKETLDLNTFDLPDNKLQVLLPLQCVLHSYTHANGKKEYSPFEIYFLSKSKPAFIIAKEIAIQKNLKKNDTIAVSISQMIYE